MIPVESDQDRSEIVLDVNFAIKNDQNKMYEDDLKSVLHQTLLYDNDRILGVVGIDHRHQRGKEGTNYIREPIYIPIKVLGLG